MELANNTWNKGLLMDTHPMMQGNDSMTDCLNGTLISMNGNEVILQNDMGNRRIDHAFLPSGYEPVGIKEHGGVIYVASYNPITNKSLIGSFPSPERVIDVNDDDLINTFDFDKFFYADQNIIEDSTLKIPVMVSDSFLIPLTPKNKLYVGDIFTVYSPNLSELKSDLTNYDNVYEGKVYSPKNRKYTLLLGILNEQNNFNDITSSLVRWNSPCWEEVTVEEYTDYEKTKKIEYYIYENNVWEKVTEEEYNSFTGDRKLKYFIYVPPIIRNLENKSQLYKFNVGYFIPDDFVTDVDIDGETIDDTNLIKSRKQIAANTFSYKLAGPLYLKASYNHISKFGYSINGTWDGTTINLKITGHFTYNCPDGVSAINSVDDLDYYTFEEGKPNSIYFDFFGNNSTEKIEPKQTITNCVYNKSLNIYTVTVIQEYNNIEYSKENYNYVIGVYGGKYNNNNNDATFYIKDLSSIGQINLKLLNSGNINLKQYKFYNTAESLNTTMTLEFETYPKEGETYEDIYLKFKNIYNDTEPDKYLFLHQPILNGKLVFSFNWDESISDENEVYDNIKLLPLQTYAVTIYYTKVLESAESDLDYVNAKIELLETLNSLLEESTSEELQALIDVLTNEILTLRFLETYEENIQRWFLTTELFNDLYSSNLADYCNNTLTDTNDLFLKKLTIAPDKDLLSSLYKLQYGEVVFTPLYKVIEDGESFPLLDSITLKQSVSFIKKADTLILDTSDYPAYIGSDIELVIDGSNGNAEIVEEVKKNLYEALSSIYKPIRTVEQYKNKLSSFIGHAYSNDETGDDGDVAEVTYLYKNENTPYSLSPGGGVHPQEVYINDLTNNEWKIGYSSGKKKESVEKYITNLQDLSDISGTDFSTFKGFYFPATFCVAHGGDDVSEGDCSYIGGPYFAVTRDTNNSEDIVFVKTDPSNTNSGVGDLLINWNEDYADSINIYKIIGDDIEFSNYSTELTYDLLLTGFNESIPSYGNLVFKIDDKKYEDIPEIITYDNSLLVYEYKLYKSRTSDRYINMNTGYKVLNTSLDLVKDNTYFKIENYNTIKFTGDSSYGRLARCRDDDISRAATINGYYYDFDSSPLHFINSYPTKVFNSETSQYEDIEHPNKVGFLFSNNNIYYKKDGDNEWTQYTTGEIVICDKVIYWKGLLSPSDEDGIGTFTSVEYEYVYNEVTLEYEYESNTNVGLFSAHGNALSLIYGDNFYLLATFKGKKYVFHNLFKGCEGLTDVSNLSLPIGSLTKGCYSNMFEGCILIEETPSLNASMLVTECYKEMFKNCTKLSKVVCLVSNILSALYKDTTTDWLLGVATEGEFFKKSGYNLWTESSASGIPSGWTKTEV